MNQVYAIDAGRIVHFNSARVHCAGCMIDREAGCDDIEGCCCTHQKEYECEWKQAGKGEGVSQ